MATDLLSLPLKGTSSADLEQGLLLFISTSYSHEQAEQLRGAVGEVHALRERVRALTLSEASVEEAVGSLGRYAKLITSMSSRFGTAIDDVLSGTDAQLELTWRDAHRPKAKCTLHQLGFERACALYNLGAALSYRATTRNTSDSDGLRAACQDLQQAAGALEAAGGAVAGAPWSLDKRMTADISAAALEGKRALMLAQAQRCFYERAKRDQMKGGVVAKLAAASASFYDEAASKLRAVRDVCAAGGGGDVSPPERERGGMMNKTKEKTGRGATPGAAPAPLLALVCVSEAGARMFDAWAQWHCAAEHEESHEYGPQVARLQRAVELAAEAMAKLAAGGVPPGGSGGAAGAAAVPPEVSRAFAEAEATIRASEATASKHNTHVYHERVPPVSALPAPIPKAIVKATPPAALAPPADASADVSNGAVDASQGDPFARLVPLTVLTDASVYTASLDDVLRQMSDRLQDIEQTSAGELASMDLPDSLHAVESDTRIPPSLSASISRAQSAGGTSSLSRMLTTVSQRTTDLDSLAMSIDALLEVEEGADQQLHTQHRERWACVRSAALTADARRELAEIRSDISQAEAANAALRSHHSACLEQLQLLNFDESELNAMVPRGEEGATLADLGCVADIRTLLESLRSCAAARAAALADARALAARDDVTSELVYRGDAAGGSSQAVFSKALARYEPFASRIHESASLEAELLSALRTANDDFTSARTNDPSQPHREAFFHRLATAVKAFDDIQAQLHHGLEYCAAAAERLEALQSTVTSLGAARAYERTELLEALHEETANEEARAAAAEALAEARAQQQQYPPPPPAVAPSRGFAPAAPPPAVPVAAGCGPTPAAQPEAGAWEFPPTAPPGVRRVGWADGIDGRSRGSSGAPAPSLHPPPPAAPSAAPRSSASATWAGGTSTGGSTSMPSPPHSMPPPPHAMLDDSEDAQLQAALRASLRDVQPHSAPAPHALHSYAPPPPAPQLRLPPLPSVPMHAGAPAAYAPPPAHLSSAFLPPPAGPSTPPPPWLPAPQQHTPHTPSPVQYAPPPPMQYSPPPPRHHTPPPPQPPQQASGSRGPPSHDAELAWAMAESLKLAGPAPPPRVQYSPPPPAAPPPAPVNSHRFPPGPSPPGHMAPPAYLSAAPSGMMPSIPDYRHPPPPAPTTTAQTPQSGLSHGAVSAPPARASSLPTPTPFGAPPAFSSSAAPAHAASFAPQYSAPPPISGVPAHAFTPPPGAGSFPPPPGGGSYGMPPPPGSSGGTPPPPFNAVAPPPGMPMGMGAAGRVAAPSYVPRW